MLRVISTFMCVLILSGCSSVIHRMAVGQTGELLTKASDELWYEADLDIVIEGVPAHLKLMEGLLFVKPDDRSLLSSLTKAYGGYGFVRYETDLIKSQLEDLEDEEIQLRLEKIYTKSIDYGFKFLEASGVSDERLKENISNPKVIDSMLSRLSSDKKTLEGVFFLGQSLGSLILLNRDDLRMVAQRPLVESLFNWVCRKDPDFNAGSCTLFKAMNLSLTPVMLGGNPEKGKELFLEGIKKYPGNWILRTSLLRFHSIPQEDEDEFFTQKAFFEKVGNRFRMGLIYSPGKYREKNKFALFQSLALKRYEIIRSLENELF